MPTTTETIEGYDLLFKFDPETNDISELYALHDTDFLVDLNLVKLLKDEQMKEAGEMLEKLRKNRRKVDAALNEQRLYQEYSEREL